MTWLLYNVPNYKAGNIITPEQLRDTVKFGTFRENFIFMKSVKRHIYDVKNSRLGHDLPTSVNDISPFREGLFSRNFAYAKFRKNKTLAKISEFTVFERV